MEIRKHIKPLLPSLKERKRYLAFEIISEQPIKDLKAVSESIWQSTLNFLGENTAGEAGIWILQDKYNKTKQRGLIKVNNKHLERLKTSLMLVKSINKINVTLHTLGVSGVLKKAENSYIAA